MPADNTIAGGSSEDAGTRLKAIGLICIAMALFACLDSSAKYLTTVKGLPVMQVVFMRYFAHVLGTILIVGPMAVPGLLRSRKPMAQAVRSLAMLSSTVFNFMALQYLQLDQTVTIFFTGPLLIALLAGPLLGEWVGPRRLAAIFVGFTGVIFVTQPWNGSIHWAFALSFASVTSYALYVVLTRFLAAHDAPLVTQFYTPVAGLAIIAPFGLAAWQWPADMLSWALLFALGALGGLGHWLLILAHRYVAAPVLSPFSYSQIIWMVSMGWIVFGNVPTGWTIAGGSIVVGSGLYLLYRERKVKGVS